MDYTEPNAQSCVACNGRGVVLIDGRIVMCAACNGTGEKPFKRPPVDTRQTHTTDKRGKRPL